ncbi:hypothetical protein LAZ67_3002826 [Cordylochernes scorpioides]|uniref:Transposase n=1 Tax=Cordylochernes scorpioides TaxID=51811 RepID=A0ABY6K829_9ARAC|nr:hypothetical protein LAZ67_3002826 [Cordylochernes scorpioides]
MPGHRKRRQFKQTDAFTGGHGDRTEKGRNAGATRVTSARVDRRILRQAVAAPQATCTAILQHVQDTLDHSISTRTISRRLVANGLHSCRPLRILPLTPPNRRQRLEWCRARSTWMTEWHRVVFSDESRFCLSSDSRRVRVWRRRGERSNPAAIVERPTVRQRGIMVWGAIAYDSRSPLLRIQGTMTAQRYVDDVLRPVTLPYLQGVPNALYQQDNARPHTAHISQQALQNVQMLPWPPYSPDLSPIEHVWDIIGRRLHALPQPRSEDELWKMVEREWRAIPQDAIRTLIDSLPRRVAACIAHFSGDGEDYHQPSAWNRQAVHELGGSRRSCESTPHGGGNRRLHQGRTKEKEAGGLRSGRTESQEGLRPGSGHEANSHPTPRSKVQECTSTRQKQALFRARSAAGKVAQCVNLGFCPDFSQAQYFLALEAKLGKGTVYQLAKIEGQILVGLSSVRLADKLVEEGLDIEDATLRAFPLRKRAERVVLGNIFFFVEDVDLVAALRPCGQVTSIVQQWMELVDSSWADSRREAFITLRDGVKLSQIPAPLDVKSKGMATHVYVTYGIKCSLCNRQGHKRANFPRKTGLQERHLLLPVDAPLGPTAIPSKPPLSNSNAPPPPVAAPPPAAAVVADSPPSDTVRTEEAVDLTSPTPENQSENKEPESSQEGRNMA